MARLGLEQFLSLYFIIFLICPKRIQPAIFKQEAYDFDVRRPSNVIDVSPMRRTEWAKTIVKDDQKVLKDVNDEPGFEFNDDEIKKFKLWPKGIIPYYIDTFSYNDKVLRDRIRLFLNTVNGLTKLRFVELPSVPQNKTTRYVFFVNRQSQLGCFDHSINKFTLTGVQPVNLGYDCLLSGGELGEAVMAIAGVPAQHNAPTRDFFITISEENIKPGKQSLFKKLEKHQWLFDCDSYDYESVTHFDHHKHSVNGKATIHIANEIDLPDGHLGENRKFTITDILKLRMLYNYIVRQDEGDLPTCEKLFQKGAHFREDIDAEIIVPRPRTECLDPVTPAPVTPDTETPNTETPDTESPNTETPDTVTPDPATTSTLFPESKK